MSFLVMILVLVTEAWAQQTEKVVHEAFPERVPMDLQAAAKQAPAPISLRLADAFQEGRNVYDLGSVSAEQIAEADQAAAKEYAHVRPGPLRIGVVRSVGTVPLSIQSSALRISSPDGGHLWTLAIRSPGAFGLRLHFTNFDVGEGSVIVYARDADDVIVRGPFSGKGPEGTGEFWTASLPGDTAFIEVSGSDEPRLEVAKLVHYDKHPAGLVQAQEGAAAPQQVGCHLDVMCESVNPFARDATAWLAFINSDGSRTFFCTGTLLNDLDSETFVPYLLTAYHCGIRSNNVNSLEAVYLFQRSSCGGSLPSFMSLPRSTGGTVLESNPDDGGNDMTFIRLNGNLPPGVALAGWTTGHPDPAYGIHHPAGSWKRAVFVSPVGICGGCTFCADPSDYDFYDMDNGLIEGGSSGSGVFNSAGQLAGQLYGTCCPDPADCGDESIDCSNIDEFKAYYGEFETTHPIIQRWLVMGGTIHVDRAYAGEETGEPHKPFNTVGEANSLAWNGARIKIKAGSYPETLTFAKRLTVFAHGGTASIGK
jgi:hypothetical protein